MAHALSRCGRERAHAARAAASTLVAIAHHVLGGALSSCQSGYLAQPLKRQVDERDRIAVRASRLTKNRRRSRASSRDWCGQRWKRTASRRASARSRTFARAGFGGGIFDDDVHPLDARQMADDLGIDPGDWRELARPVGAVVRPGQPGGGVRLPLGGHAVAERGGRVCVVFTALRQVKLTSTGRMSKLTISASTSGVTSKSSCHSCVNLRVSRSTGS